MTMFRARILLVSLLVAATACGPAADRGDLAREPAAATGSDAATHAAGTAAEAHATGGEAEGGHEEGGHSPDGHAPPAGGGQALLPIMQRLGSEMTALTYALMTDDHETVTRSAGAIAEHAPISAEELERIQAMLGADMARFEAVDESVHVASVRLRDAAAGGQRDLVVQRLGEVQRGCVSCHTQFRERLRTNRATP